MNKTSKRLKNQGEGWDEGTCLWPMQVLDQKTYFNRSEFQSCQTKL